MDIFYEVNLCPASLTTFYANMSMLLIQISYSEAIKIPKHPFNTPYGTAQSCDPTFCQLHE